MLTHPKTHTECTSKLSEHRATGGSYGVTADQAPRPNFKSWTREVSRSYGGLNVLETGLGACEGSLRERDLGHLRIVEIRGTPQAFQRTPSLISGDSEETITLSLVQSGTARLVQDGRSCTLEAGDFCFLESTRPYRFEFLEPTRIVDFVWARPLMRISSEQARKLTALVFRDANPLSAWLCRMLQELLSVQHQLSQAGAMGLAHGMAEIVRTTVLESLPDPEDSDARLRYDKIIAFIEDNLAEQDLSLETIAEQFHLSTRTVNRTFEKFGASVAATIRDSRLEKCRQMMLSPSCREQSLGWIIRQCGISSPQVFSRMFATKYGKSPSEYRRTMLGVSDAQVA